MDANAPPTEASLHEAALSHLARYATTQAGLVRVLDRRIERWARAAAADGEAVQAAKRMARAVATRLAASGTVDDAGFAASRAGRLVRSGHSRRAVAAHLAARGIAAATARALFRPTPSSARPWRWRNAAGSARSATAPPMPRPRGANSACWHGRAFRARLRRARSIRIPMPPWNW